MKSSITVDGVTLTRAQVEAAHKALNTPDAPPLPILTGGDLVVSDGSSGAPRNVEGVVVGGPVAELLAAEYGKAEGSLVRFTDGVNSWTVRSSSLRKYGRFGVQKQF